jgi:hypothetical protein
MSSLARALHALSAAALLFFAQLPLVSFDAAAQFESARSDDPLTDGEIAPPGGELSCVAPPTQEEIEATIEAVRKELRKLGNWGLRPLWNDVIKKWLEDIGAKDLPGAAGLLCSSDKTLEELVRDLNGGGNPYKPGVIDNYFGFDMPHSPLYNPSRLPKLKELIEGIRTKTDSQELKEALERAAQLIDRLRALFDICGPPSPAELELLSDLFENFKELIDNVITRPKEKLSYVGEGSPPLLCATTVTAAGKLL